MIKPKLRVIIDKPKAASFNMAADLYLFDRCIKESETLFLRLYQWQRPSITLGYMQKKEMLNNAVNYEKDGIELIRRSTGGRAVLHWDDLTYSFSFSKEHIFLGQNIETTYSIISLALEEALTFLGVTTEKEYEALSAKKMRGEIKLPCFLSPARNELLVNGCKLIGSAQKRGKDSVIQHGSIPLNGNFRKVVDYLGIPLKHKVIIQKELLTKTVSLDKLINELNISSLHEAISRGFSKVIGVESGRLDWNQDELSKINQIADSDEFKRKYFV